MTMHPRDLASGTTKDGVYKAASITFRGQAFSVPAGKESYQTVKISSRANISMVSKRGLMKLGINVWRSSSHDVLGPWGSAIMSEMLTYGQMYTLESKTIQAEVAGTGIRNKGQTLTGTADYIGHLEFPLLASDEYYIPVQVTANMEKSFLPGEMLIFVPVID
nr:MAG TPA: hypothetical protein [Caudoviricetes sp.]